MFRYKLVIPTCLLCSLDLVQYLNIPLICDTVETRKISFMVLLFKLINWRFYEKICNILYFNVGVKRMYI
jgi:hypothetical protein